MTEQNTKNVKLDKEQAISDAKGDACFGYYVTAFFSFMPIISFVQGDIRTAIIGIAICISFAVLNYAKFYSKKKIIENGELKTVFVKKKWEGLALLNYTILINKNDTTGFHLQLPKQNLLRRYLKHKYTPPEMGDEIQIYFSKKMENSFYTPTSQFFIED